MEISTGTGIVIFGILYLLNNVFSAAWSIFMQTKRLASEERQAKIAASVEMKGNLETHVHRGL